MCTYQFQLLNQAHAWFLKIALCGCRYACLCVCVCPRAIKNHSCEVKPEYPIKQVLLLFSFFVRHLLSILLMGGTLVTKHVVSYCQRRARYCYICCSLHGKSRLTSCTLLTKMQCFSFKSGHAVWVAKLTKQDWPIMLQ